MEYGAENLCGYRRGRGRGRVSKKRKRLTVSIVVILAIIGLFLTHYYVFIVPLLTQASEQNIRALAVVAIEDAAADTFTTDYTYADFVQISRDSDGDIILMQANTMLIHSLVRTSIARAHYNLNIIEEEGITVPLGVLFGIAFFAGYGRDIALRVLPVGIMTSHLHSEFIAAGINQTLHRITLTLRAEVTVILPGLESRVIATVPVPIIESTIVGRVPDVFFQNDLFNRSLNLVP